jgi:hypothetical protein
VQLLSENTNRPVLFFYPDQSVQFQVARRSLASSSGNVTALTEAQISQYQVCFKEFFDVSRLP